MIDSRAWAETHPAVGPNTFVIRAAVPQIAIIAVSEIRARCMATSPGLEGNRQCFAFLVEWNFVTLLGLCTR